MQYSYKNITVDVTTLCPNYIEFTGETYLTISKDLLLELIEKSCTFAEFYLHSQGEELWNKCDNDIDTVLSHIKELKEFEFEIFNTDAIVAIYEYALSSPNREFNFNVTTENISWVVHDILHAKHDAAGCSIYVEASIEKARILESLKITQEQFSYLLPGAMFLENLENEFYNRFQEHLDLGEFKYLEEY